jgi:eukaryotic-like serine/threonine-protein kinase
LPETWGPAVIKDLRAGDPASVGPYRLLGRLGAGGMGEVYLAKSPGGRLVAIKLIRPELAEERGFRARFASEITAARNVSGIYTAAVVDADADAELPWMATVYVPGPSLTDAVEDNGPLPVKTVLALAAGLAEALQAIHRVGLVHRDLKPSNVLLASDGPRVIDFGISLALERSMMTATGMVMGSPGFMSPEQAMGQREVGAPTDVFSLGAVLAFAATGSSPFGIGPTPALLYRVVNEAPDLAAVPVRLSPLIGQCLAKNAADRPTPAEVLELLGDDVEVLTGEWLPSAITQTMIRYTPDLATPAPRSADSDPLGAARPGGTELAAIPAAATVAEHSLLPDTSLVPAPGAVTAGRESAGGTGGTPPAGPQSPLRRWRWPIAAAVAAVIVAVVAILLTSHSTGGKPKTGVHPTTSLAGHTTTAPASRTTSARPSNTPAQQPTSQPAVSTPATHASPTTAPPTSQSPTPTSTPTPTTTPSATSTPTPSTSSSPASAPTTSAPPQTQAPSSATQASNAAPTSNIVPASSSDPATPGSAATTSNLAPAPGSVPAVPGSSGAPSGPAPS